MQLHLPPVLTELGARDASLLVVSFATMPHLQKWIPHFQSTFLEPYYEEHKLELPADPLARTRFVSDPALSAYHAYGLGRNSVLKVYGPGIMLQYARWAIQGKPIKKPPEDPLQRGGDFVINANSRLTFAHLGHDQSDRPPVSAILSALK